MPSTPSHLKNGFQRNTYNRVSYGKNSQDQNAKEKSPDIEPLNGKSRTSLYYVRLKLKKLRRIQVFTVVSQSKKSV